MNDELYYTYFDPGIEIGLTLDDACQGSHQGDCADDVAELRRLPYIADQLAEITANEARAALKPYGAWDAGELADHEVNLQRIVWLACGNVSEEAAG